MTSDEIAADNQESLDFDEARLFDKGQQQSFMFFAIELKDSSYVSGRYAEFARDIPPNPSTVMKYIRDADSFHDHAGEKSL